MSNKLRLTLILIFIQLACYAQETSDLSLVLSSSLNTETVSLHEPTVKRKRLVPYLFKPGFFAFKHVIYNQMGMTCIYQHPCMNFCGALIERYGVVKGYFLSFDRVVRCNRLSPIETYPSGLSANGKLIDYVSDYQN